MTKPIYLLTFTLTGSSGNLPILLNPDAINYFVNNSDKQWRELYTNIQGEEKLTPYSYELLKKKWLIGRAAIVICNNIIVSYLSLNYINLRQIQTTLNYDFYEAATGWTKKSFRGVGINTLIRRNLIELYLKKSSLFSSFTRGKGAASLLIALNWKLIAWEEYPFVSSLVGWREKNNLFYKFGFGTMREYRKFNNNLTNIAKFDDNKLYLWVNNIELALELEDLLKERFESVERFRKEIITYRE